MNLKCFMLALMSFISQLSFSQENNHVPFHQNFIQQRSSGTSGTGANIDVKYHKIYWRINPDSTKYIKGYVQTNFLTTENNVSSISFDLNAVLFVDSVKFHNALLPTTNLSHSGNILTIDLGTTIANGSMDSLWIYYQGIPPDASGARQGYQIGNDGIAGNYITTLSESYEDRDWWPCKADMQDKIDSIDIVVNVPWASPSLADTFWVASNGKLIDSSISGDSRTFRYTSHYPIASYLVFVSVARYNRYYPAPVVIGGTPTQVVYDLLAGKSLNEYSDILTAMNNVNLVLSAFSAKYGDYPFKREKHGFYDGLLGAGGMEHQTFSGIATGALQNTITLSHELTHQWFGDNVTFATWNDLWLAEGFATYGEILAAELVPSLGLDAFSIRSDIKSSALSLAGQSAWIPNANSLTSNGIWNSSYGATVYDRGAMVVSMLRTICGDAKFFQAITAYQTSLAGKSATTDSLKNLFNIVLGQDLTLFFDDYVGGSGKSAAAVGGIGNPKYAIGWSNLTGNEFNVSVIAQSKTPQANVSYFRGPVALRIKGSLPSQDTSIVFFDWGAGELSYAGNGLSNPISGNSLTYNLSFTPITVLYDDSAKTLSTGTVSKLGAASGPQITNFAGYALNSNNEINLTVLSGITIIKAELYKSNDGINFSFEHEIDLTGISGQTYTYHYVHRSPYEPVTYYRALVYYDSNQLASDDIDVTRNITSNNFIITPNPSKDLVTVRFLNNDQLQTEIRLISSDGKTIARYMSKNTVVNFHANKFAAGIYVVQVRQNGKIVNTGKLLITR